MEEQINPIQDIGIQIATELEEKNRLLDDFANEQPIEKVVQARIQQLAISKVILLFSFVILNPS